jgi:cytochrome P450
LTSVTMAESAVPTAPGKLPGLGHAVGLARDPLGFLGSLPRVGGVVRVLLGPRPVYVVSEPELVTEMLVTKAHACPRGSMHDVIKDNFGEGLLAIDGDVHRTHRRALQPLFTTDRVNSHIGAISRLIEERVNGWESGQEIDVLSEMMKLSFDLVTSVVLGVQLSDKDRAAFLGALPKIVKGLIAHALFPHPLLKRLPLPLNRSFAKSVGILMEVVDHTIQLGAQGNTSSVLDHMRRHFTEEDIRAEVVTLLVASTETTAVTGSWLLHELTKHPQVAARVVGEIREHIGATGEVTEEALGRLEYTASVVREVLRLHAPNAFLMRRAEHAVRLGQYEVPAGAELLFCLTMLHRNAGLYTAPLAFDPDRWNGSVSRHAYLPFGAGRHKCIGMGFAETELLIMAVHLLRAWQFSPVPGGRVKEVAWTTVQPRGLRMRLQAVS